VALAMVGERVALRGSTSAGNLGSPNVGSQDETTTSQDGSSRGNREVATGHGGTGRSGVGLPTGFDLARQRDAAPHATPPSMPFLQVPGATSPAPGLPQPGGSAQAPAAIDPFDSMLDDLVALHAYPLPPETTNPDELRKFEPLVGVPVRRPAWRSASYRGARLHAMRGAHRTAILQYQLPDRHRVTMYVFNPRGVQMGKTRLQPRVVKEEPIYVGQLGGYSLAACERRGVGYALATDLDADESVRMVAAALP
jgi:hypothetical protein